VDDSSPAAASAKDIFVLDNALGYALNQGGTAQFSVPFNNNNPFEFPVDYAVVTFAGSLSGEQAQQFFNHVGTIDPKLWSALMPDSLRSTQVTTQSTTTCSMTRCSS